MKKIFLSIICLFGYLLGHAQEKLLIKGHFGKNYSYGRHLDNKVANLFFVLERGHVVLPEDVYVFELSLDDTQRLQQKSVRVVPFFDSKICRNYDTEFTLEVIPIPNTEGAYYSKKIYNGEKIVGEYPQDYDETHPSVYQKLIKGKEVLYREIESNRDLRDIAQWIEKLDCTDSVSVIGEICWDGYNENGMQIGGTDYFTEKMLFSEIAKHRLKVLANRFRFYDFPIKIKENATKEEWRRWLQEVMAISPTAGACRHRMLSFPYTKEGYSQEINYAYDKTTDKHLVLGVFAFGDKQLMQLDFDCFAVKFLPVEGLTSFRDFYAENDVLYTINTNFVWTRYTKVGNGPYQKEKDVHLFSVPRGKNHLLSTVFTSNTLYLLYAYYSEKKREYIHQKVMCVDTKTGDKLNDLDLASLLPPGEKIMDFFRWHNKAQHTRFPIVVKTLKGYYHFLIERERCIQTTFLGKEFPYVWNFVDADPPYYLKNDYNKLYKIDINNKESKKPLLSVPNRWTDHIFAILDEKYLNFFYACSDAFTDKIMLQKLDKHTLEVVGDAICIYSQAILERRSSSNLPSYINAFKTPQGWNVIFLIADRNTFHWVQVPE